MTLPIAVIICHFIFDWVLQNDWMALNKSKNNLVLLSHSLVATIYCLWWGPTFWLSNLLFHFVTDYFTSRGTSKLWFMRPVPSIDGEGWTAYWVIKEPNTRHWFFVLIGFDQLIHYICLAVTYKLLVS
jgi:hypothetical protein